NQPQVVISNGQPLISFPGVAAKVLATANDARAYPGLTVATVLKSLGTLGTFCGTSDTGFTVGWFWEQNNQPPNAAVELRNQAGTAFVGSTDGGSSNQGNGLLHADFARLSA